MTFDLIPDSWNVVLVVFVMVTVVCGAVGAATIFGSIFNKIPRGF